MRKLLQLTICIGLWHRAGAQSHGGMEQYYSMQDHRTFSVMPVVYYESSKDWYAEGRYNYEAAKTMSLYAGRTFKRDKKLAYEISPMAGIVAGEFKGGSAGVNVEMEYKRFSLSSQSQYTFSVEDNKENFVYSWTDAGYTIFKNFMAGVSLQQTRVYKYRQLLEGGLFVKAEFKDWSLPLYFFNPLGRQTYVILGLQCEWQYKKTKKAIK